MEISWGSSEYCLVSSSSRKKTIWISVLGDFLLLKSSEICYLQAIYSALRCLSKKRKVFIKKKNFEKNKSAFSF